jgi:ketosteroid isomerase-like protein
VEPTPAADELAIRDLVARYVEAVATGDAELYRSVWAPDAVWDVDGRGRFHGPDAITELFVKLRVRQEFAIQRLMSGRVALAGDGEGGAGEGHTATGRWVIHSLTRTDGQGSELAGIYDDRYARTSDGWRFVERVFHPLYRGPVELPGRVFTPPELDPL